MSSSISLPSVSVKYAQDGSSTESNALAMRPMRCNRADGYCFIPLLARLLFDL